MKVISQSHQMHACKSPEAISLLALASSGFPSLSLKHFSLCGPPRHSLVYLDSPLQMLTRNTSVVVRLMLFCFFPTLPSSTTPDSITPAQMFHLFVAHELSPERHGKFHRVSCHRGTLSHTHTHIAGALWCSWCTHSAHHSSCLGGHQSVCRERTPS